jgi:hypothetical protein
VGTIRWPLRLQEEAAFHNYVNDPIQTALYDAFSTIFDILVGATPHPLAQLFDEYVQKARKKFEATHRRRASDEDLHGLAQHFSFPVPCLPGDESLIDDFLADLGVQLHKESKLISSSLRYHHIGPIFFRLVILRGYLHKLPENDYDIFQLVKQKRVYRIWTSHELALAACHGEENTSPDSFLGYAPAPSLFKLAVINDTDIVIPDDETFVAIRSPESINWTSGMALSGGLRKPRRYTPPHLRLTAPRPQPQPRPAYTKIVHFENQSAEASGRTGRVMAEERVVRGGADVAGASSTNHQSGKKTRARIPLGIVVENSEEITQLRRSKRARRS